MDKQHDARIYPLLCEASGETDLPAAFIAHNEDDLRHFITVEWTPGEGETEGLIGFLEKYDWREHGGEYSFEFEIGGMSFKRVYETARLATPRAVEVPQDVRVPGVINMPEEPPHDVLVVMSGEWHSSRHGKAREQYKAIRAQLLASTPATPAQPDPDWPDVSPEGLRKMAEIAAPNNARVFNAAADVIEGLQGEPCRPDIIERLSYHALERDDLTLDDCLGYLASGWSKVHGRTERQMVLQLTALLAAQPEQVAQDGGKKGGA